MKKIVSLLLCCIMILFSIGCNNDKETEKNDSKKINIVPVNNKITIDNVNMDFTVKNYATNFFDIEDDITNSFEYEDDLIAIDIEVVLPELVGICIIADFPEKTPASPRRI